MFRFISSLVVIACVSSSVASAEYKEERTLTQKTSSINAFSIDVGAGDLAISSQKGLKEIQVEATIVVGGFSKSKGESFAEDHIELTLTKKGGTAFLVCRINSDGGRWLTRVLSGSANAHVDIDILVPENISLNIDDGSGDIEMRDLVQNVKLDDGSGDINIKYLTGKLTVDDGSGDLKIDTVKGDIKIDDGSGDVTVKNAEGDVSIDDGSGDIRFTGIMGSVDVKDDGSGDIRLSAITEDVRIGDSGSGDVYLNQVSGSVTR